MRVDKWGRCTVPAKVRGGVPPLQPSGQVLGVLEPGGLVRLETLERAPEVQTEMDALGGTGDAAGTDGRLLLMGRYARIGVDSTSRLELPNHVAAHLGSLGGGVIFILRAGARLELWSSEHHEARLVAAEALATHLP